MTTTAWDVAAFPKILEAAITDDRSLMAVPAHSPKACCDSPSARPRVE